MRGEKLLRDILEGRAVDHPVKQLRERVDADITNWIPGLVLQCFREHEIKFSHLREKLGKKNSGRERVCTENSEKNREVKTDKQGCFEILLFAV